MNESSTGGAIVEPRPSPDSQQSAGVEPRPSAGPGRGVEPRYAPTSTYRLQVHGGFPLPAARDVVSYLNRLGAGACYTAPYFAAAPGSTHG